MRTGLFPVIGVLLGIALGAIGALTVLSTLFHLGFPILRFTFGAVVVLLGLWLIVRAMGWVSWRGMLSGSASYSPDSSAPERLEYNVVFGRGEIDLTRLGPGDRRRHVEVNVFCGEALVTVGAQVPIEVEANSAFGSARLPNGSTVAFGQLRYDPRYPDGRPALLSLELNVCGGSCSLLEAR